MSRHVRLNELLVGVEGLALLRELYDGADAAADERLAEVRELLADDALLDGEAIREAAPRDGYAAWSESYDDPGNPIVTLEEPAVWAFVDRLAVGKGLDAACGTGRHARHLVQLGHDVTGIDVTPEMLERAAENVPAARFQEADVRAIPAADGAFDFAVCGLALAHLDDLDPGVAELARVLAPGGHLVVSVLHPVLALLGWHAPFLGADGERGFVREHPHRHCDYLAAFAASGLELRGCAEPLLTAELVRAKRRAYGRVPEATLQAYAGLPGVLVWDAVRSS